MGGALGSVPHTPRCTWCTGHAPALLHVVAEPSHVARVVWWLKGSGRQAPTAHGAQPAVRLGCVQAGRAVSGSSTGQREAGRRSSMASAARMVLKPSSHSSITGRRRCSHSNVAGGWTLLRNLGAPLTAVHCSASPRRRHSCELHHADLTRIGLVSRACGTLADERGPERDSCASPEVTALSPFRVTYSWTHPGLGFRESGYLT